MRPLASMDLLPGWVGAAVRSTTEAGLAWVALPNSSTNWRSGTVLGPTHRISSNQAVPICPRLVGVPGSLPDGISEIPDRWSGVRSLGPVASPADDEPILEVEAALPAASTLSDKLMFSESDISLMFTNENIITFSEVVGAGLLDPSLGCPR
ncbi:hypothetical protein TIFTF001_033765 [Ficus carica]|uniref:Uncharacterized protein n=1 Tax=Ficus carica TaxID=3494 RepID=A0AA88E1D2_FICCA|nr:hypothetical protein TIFTF001_033765 [Ficus carica]